MNLDILANGAPPPWRRKNDGKDSENGSGPPRGRVARVMDRAHTPTHTQTYRSGCCAQRRQHRNLASAQWSQQLLTGYGMGSNVESKLLRSLKQTLLLKTRC